MNCSVPDKMSPPNGQNIEFSMDNNGDGSANVCEKNQLDWKGPPAQGLYDPQNEHEACGVGFIVAIDGKRSHKVIRNILQFAAFMSII